MRSSSTIASWCLLSGLAMLVSACGDSSDPDLFSDMGDPDLFSDTGDPVDGECSVTGKWATFVEIGVGWESGTIKPGAGIVRQWILSERELVGGQVRDLARVCGVGARLVPLGSPWFATRQFDLPDYTLPSEWTGVEFLAQQYDDGRLPATELFSVVGGDPAKPQIGATFETPASPFLFGLESLPPDAEWPDVPTMQPLMVDHDGDGKPGITGVPFEGPVPGEPDGTIFSKPRLGIEEVPARAGELYMGLRTRGALSAELVSCDPPTLKGHLVGETLRIESRNVACVVDSGDPCTPEQADWIDTNLPVFEPNGTSTMTSIKVPANTTCADVRTMTF